MDALEQVNQHYGLGKLKLTSAGAPKARKIWVMQHDRISTGLKTDLEAWPRRSDHCEFMIATIQKINNTINMINRPAEPDSRSSFVRVS